SLTTSGSVMSSSTNSGGPSAPSRLLSGVPGGGDHVVQRVAHHPLQIPGSGLTGGDDPSWVTPPAGSGFGSELDPGHFAHRRHDLAHRHPITRAEVVHRLQSLALAQCAGGNDVGVREVGDVDVVADARAIR